jgi:hypothetical protein
VPIPPSPLHMGALFSSRICRLTTITPSSQLSTGHLAAIITAVDATLTIISRRLSFLNRAFLATLVFKVTGAYYSNHRCCLEISRSTPTTIATHSRHGVPLLPSWLSLSIFVLNAEGDIEVRIQTIRCLHVYLPSRGHAALSGDPIYTEPPALGNRCTYHNPSFFSTLSLNQIDFLPSLSPSLSFTLFFTPLSLFLPLSLSLPLSCAGALSLSPPPPPPFPPGMTY